MEAISVKKNKSLYYKDLQVRQTGFAVTAANILFARSTAPTFQILSAIDMEIKNSKVRVK